MRFAHGRWDREQPHHVEVVHDGPGCWAQCTCGYQGEVHHVGADADRDADQHERHVFDVRRQGKRMVRGRIE